MAHEIRRHARDVDRPLCGGRWIVVESENVGLVICQDPVCPSLRDLACRSFLDPNLIQILPSLLQILPSSELKHCPSLFELGYDRRWTRDRNF